MDFEVENKSISKDSNEVGKKGEKSWNLIVRKFIN